MPDLNPFEFSIPASGGPHGGQPSEGPINWQVAEQVAGWLARQWSDTSIPSDIPDYAELLRVAEMRTEDMVAPLPDASARTFTPSLVTAPDWATSSVKELRYVLELLARHMSTAAGPEPQELQVPLQAMITPMLPVLLGGQFGLLIGRLACWIFSGFDVLLPRTAAPVPKIVPSAVMKAAKNYEIDHYDAALWVTLHEYVHLRQFLVPWVRKFLAKEVERAISMVEFNPDAVAEKLAGVDPSNPASIEVFVDDPTGLLNALIVPAPRQATEKLRAAVAIFEAAAEHISAVAAVRLASDPDKTREMMRRHYVERGPAESLLLRLTGVEAESKDLAAGLVFCQFVTAEAGFSTLNRIWNSPDSLPTFEEMAEPVRWLERTAD